MDALTEIGTRTGTDKATHHKFTEFYNSKFENIRDEVKTVIEIGILHGASLKMWEQYFPNARIYGIDHGICNDLDNGRIVTIQASQSRENELIALKQLHFKNTYADIIVDDGSHFMRDQQITFAHLFHIVKPGGVYIIEDAQTSLHARYIGHPNFITTLNMFSNYQKTKKLHCDYLKQPDLIQLEEYIDEVEIWSRTPGRYDESTCIYIRKK